ncbi:MAG TPA: phosphodiester glycosidase family protein, partial [Tissierellaceae bacterium]|nr:phosphodiester glycosidase family protein [Tissierellaceae bacterium]
MEINKIKIKFNKNNIKKILVSFLAAATMFTSATPALAQIPVNVPPVIHERQSATPISSGVTHEHIQKFTTLGWWNINVLRVNLNDPYTNVQGIFSEKGISSRSNVSSMVEKSNAVAGINGDFFDYSPVAVSLGTLINDGEIISSRADHAEALPAIFIDLLNNAEINYLKKQTTATNLNTGDVLTAGLINSVMKNFDLPIVLTPKWGEKSLGTKYRNDLVEVVVVEDKVASIRKGQEAVPIPENGYVLVARGEEGNKMMNFSIGDPIVFNMNSNIDIKNIKFSIGGGSYILKNGQLNKPDISKPGNHPRTGIGISQDGKQLILVTIDGRGTSFKGVEQELFASILRDLGAYNAINLDGGGSTTMAIKPLDKDKSQVVNAPSEGGERQVVNGVGVYSNAPIDKLSYLKVTTIDNKMFPNTSRKIEVKGYDKYHNPVEIDPSNLSFHYEGDKGIMTENIYKALVPGNTKITAKYEDILGELDLKVLGEPVDIISNTSSLYLDKNSEIKLPMFYGKDANGVQISISPEDLEFEISNDVGTIENNVFYSNDKINAGILTAKRGSGVENIKIYVGNSESLIHGLNSLNNIKFSAYPDLVTGSISQDP